MTQRERESLAESDPHTLLFGPDEHDHAGAPPAAGPVTRSERLHGSRQNSSHERHRRNGRLIVLIVAVLVVVVGAVGYVAIRNAVQVKDYSGSGSGSVQVTVQSGDSASGIGHTLLAAGVVKSVKAFTRAADSNSASHNIQPGTYTLHKHMSGASALALMLDPAARNTANDVVVTEGAITLDVASRMAKVLHVSNATVQHAMGDVSALGLPSTYTTSTGDAPTSLEGFLYPATYSVDSSDKLEDVLTQMINKFIEQDRANGYAAKARANHISAYEALIIASIAQSEAVFPEDMPKVARVILNRIAAHMPLQIDATSAYAAKLQGLDPAKVIYAHINSPYNTYTHDGLPPTPISNPGADAMAGAAQPASGNWLYYVNGDKAGHLFFTNSETEFAQAVEKCRTNHWGCG